MVIRFIKRNNSDDPVRYMSTNFISRGMIENNDSSDIMEFEDSPQLDSFIQKLGPGFRTLHPYELYAFSMIPDIYSFLERTDGCSQQYHSGSEYHRPIDGKFVSRIMFDSPWKREW